MTVLVAPIIPAINDHEIEAILKASYAAGAREAGYVLLRLPHELKELMRDWLVGALSRQAQSRLLAAAGGARRQGLRFRNGASRQTGVGPFAWMLGRRFETATARLGMNTRRIKLRTDLFAPPAKDKVSCRCSEQSTRSRLRRMGAVPDAGRTRFGRCRERTNSPANRSAGYRPQA